MRPKTSSDGCSQELTLAGPRSSSGTDRMFAQNSTPPATRRATSSPAQRSHRRTVLLQPQPDRDRNHQQRFEHRDVRLIRRHRQGVGWGRRFERQFPGGTTVSSVGTSSFVVSNNATEAPVAPPSIWRSPVKSIAMPCGLLEPSPGRPGPL